MLHTLIILELFHLAIVTMCLGLLDFLVELTDMEIPFPLLIYLPVVNIIALFMLVYALFVYKPKVLYTIKDRKYLCVCKYTGEIGYIKFNNFRGTVKVPRDALNFIKNLEELSMKMEMTELFCQLYKEGQLNSDSVVEVKGNKLLLSSNTNIA